MSRQLTIRAAHADDQIALQRLAQLDSQRLPAGPFLIAEADGAVRAAYSLSADGAVSDPFYPSAGLVDLLRVRAHAVPRRKQRTRRHAGRLAWA